MNRPLRISQAIARSAAAGLAWLLAPAVCGPAVAEPARFWISTPGVASAEPEAPTVQVIPEAIQQLHIWAQPATVGPGPYDPLTNPFKQLRNLSLNLVTDQPVVDFLDDEIFVVNPLIDGATRRFEFVHDSTSGLTSAFSEEQVQAGSPDLIRGIQGFSITGGEGIGPVCHPSDAFCATSPGGAPAWLVAIVSYQVVADSGTVNFFLQIGASGMNHTGETSAETFVVFGVDSEPVYQASVQAHREVTLDGHTPDLVVEAVAALPGDFNGDGVVDAADYVVWRKGLGTIYTPDHFDEWRAHFTPQAAAALPGDFNGDGRVDAADYVLWRKTGGSQQGLVAWRANFGATAAGSTLAGGALAVPEPASTLLLLVGAPAVCWMRRRSASRATSSRDATIAGPAVRSTPAARRMDVHFPCTHQEVAAIAAGM